MYRIPFTFFFETTKDKKREQESKRLLKTIRPWGQTRSQGVVPEESTVIKHSVTTKDGFRKRSIRPLLLALFFCFFSLHASETFVCEAQNVLYLRRFS